MARILVIDDDVNSLEFLSILLSALGHRVAGAGGGREGMERIVSYMPDLILCDIQMPYANGFDVCDFLKSEPSLRHIPIIAVTASAMAGDREHLLSAGFDEYISKPVLPERLESQLRPFLGNVPIELSTAEKPAKG